MVEYPYQTGALRINQRLGTFYVAVLPAELLLQVAASDRMRATLNPDGDGYHLEGTQRLIQDKRLKEIANYISRVDAAFPNSIILAANYDFSEESNGFEEDDSATEENSRVWTVEESETGTYHLRIPSEKKLAAVIDGQHRLFAFAKTDLKTIRSMELLCSVFVDLPKPLQAQIFATINSTQKRVDRSLTFELFGYNVSDEHEEFWTPDKLSVFFTRKLATDRDSPLRGRIMVAPKRDAALQKLTTTADWRVSTAVVVDGILRLFSSNPKRDSNLMHKDVPRKRICLVEGPKDNSPLRTVFLEGNDVLLYKTVLNYIKACNDVFWSSAKRESFILKTVGIQATFDILRKLAKEAHENRNVSAGYFEGKIAPAGTIDFADDEFRSPSGAGRTYIRRAIEKAIGLDH